MNIVGSRRGKTELRQEPPIKCERDEDEWKLHALLRERICAHTVAVLAWFYYIGSNQDAQLPPKRGKREPRGFRKGGETDSALFRDSAENPDTAMMPKCIQRCEDGIHLGVGMPFGKEFGKRKLQAGDWRALQTDGRTHRIASRAFHGKKTYFGKLLQILARQ